MPYKFLTSTYTPLHGYYFRVPQMCLGSLGFWPETRSSGRHKLWAIANFVILFIGVFTEIHAGCTYLQYDLELGLDTLCPAGTSAVTLLKMLLISYYRVDLQWVLKRMRQMLYDTKGDDAHVTSVKEQIVRAHSVMAARLNFTPFMMGFITCTAYNLKPLLLAAILWAQNKEVIWKTPFNMTMPSVLLHSPYFPLTYIFTAYTGYVTVIMFGGCDAFYFEFCSHTAALLKMLQEDIRNLFKQCKGPLPAENSKAFEAQLIRLINRHNDIIDLTRFFLRRYSIITLAHFVSAGLVIGASIFDLLTFSGLSALIYVTYTIASLGELFIYCYGGTMVAENSAHLAIVIYDCNWYNCNPKIRRMILLMLIRSQRALTMAVPFFSPSLPTFASILQTSGSIIALASSFQ